MRKELGRELGRKLGVNGKIETLRLRASRRRTVFAGLLVLLLGMALLTPAAGRIDPATVDDFEDGTTMGWQEGSPSTTPPRNVTGGGPAGEGDHYLENTATGKAEPGGKMIMFNRQQWAGDYLVVGPRPVLAAEVANFGESVLHLRVALQSGPSERSRYVSEAVVLEPEGRWLTVFFELTEEAMTRLSGDQTLAEALADVAELRILSAEAPAWNGDAVAGRLGIDNIRLLPHAE